MKDPNIVQLFNIVHADGHKLYLVFEFLDLDLKKYMEALPVSDGGRGKALPEGSQEMQKLGLGRGHGEEVHGAADRRHTVLSQPSSTTSRSQTTESSHRSRR